jgi:hypothetical protein
VALSSIRLACEAQHLGMLREAVHERIEHLVLAWAQWGERVGPLVGVVSFASTVQVTACAKMASPQRRR